MSLARSLLSVLSAAAVVVPLSVTVAAPAQARSAGCVLNVLQPAPGTPANGTSWVLRGDDTGRHLLGESTKPERWMRPVLWTDGVPQWLDPKPEFASQVYDVNNAGVVVGSTGDAVGGSHPWVFSNGQYKVLPPPPGVTSYELTGINNRGDIVGHGYDATAGTIVVIVWPGDGSTAVKLVAKGWARGLDISESGVVAGETIADGQQVSWVWDDWSKPGQALPGAPSKGTLVRAARGPWIGGNEYQAGVVTGIVWDVNGSVAARFERELTSVNAQGDGALAPAGTEGSVVARPDGTRMTFPQWTNVYHLFDRGQNASAAGYADSGNNSVVAVLWSGCTPPDHS